MSNKPHPEDEIYKVKTFINGLEKVQEEYFVRLVESLNLSKEGEDWLFITLARTNLMIFSII
jgi:hypothetical protein